MCILLHYFSICEYSASMHFKVIFVFYNIYKNDFDFWSTMQSYLRNKMTTF